VIQFLVDECLSPELVDVAREHGFNAYHVTRRGWGSDSDPQLLSRILHEDLTFVTNNWKDFRPMISRTEVHPGVIAILPNVRKHRQMALFAAALAKIQGTDPPLDMVNTVLEVDSGGNVVRYDLPPGG
jgi:predicted nuclease of predicted toxin-antitoxin system